MPNLLTRLFRREPEITRYTVNDYINWLTNNGRYGLTQPYGMPVSYARGKPAERIENSFEGYSYGAFKANPIVFGCMLARASVFSEARFMWRQIEDGRPGDLFSDDALDVLRRPWPNGTTGELLSRMIQDVDLAGNCYLVNEGDRLRRLRPDWVQIVLSGDPRTDQDVDVVGYVYTPGGPDSGDGRSYLPDEICHWSPIPDPDALYRGMSWLTPVIREIQGDSAAVDHKIAFFRNGATLGPIVKVPAGMTAAQFKEFVAAADAAHVGVENAYKPMYVGGGADVTLQAATMQQLDFKGLQGGSETRICVAARVPAVIAGVSEGLAGSSLNAGNYGTAKRSFGDGGLRPLWRSACAALMSILAVPANAELWFAERDIAFLRDDEQDIAQIQQTQASTVTSLITAGFKPESAVVAVTTNDFTKLEHTGLTSVQLMPPGSQDTNGDGVPDAEATASAEYEAALDEFRSVLEPLWEEIWRSDDGAEHDGEDFVERADYYNVRVAKGMEGGGRFRKLSDIIGQALNDWLNGDGEADDPLEPFTREQLRKASKELGVEPRRGASAEEIKLGLLKDARTRFRSERGQGEPSHRLTLSSPKYRDQDVGVYQEKSGKVSLYRESSTGRRGARIASFDDLAGLESWGRDNDEPQVAEWAAKERGGKPPVKKAAPRKAAPAKAAPRKAAKSVPAKATPKPKREPLGDPAAKIASLRALGDVEAVRDDLDLHTVAELKILAGEVGVATSGRKRDVVDRITEKLQAEKARPSTIRDALASVTTDAKTVADAIAQADINDPENLRDWAAKIRSRASTMENLAGMRLGNNPPGSYQHQRGERDYEEWQQLTAAAEILEGLAGGRRKSEPLTTVHGPRYRPTAIPVRVIVAPGANSESSSWKATGFEGIDEQNRTAISAVTGYLRRPGFMNTRLRTPEPDTSPTGWATWLHDGSPDELLGRKPFDVTAEARAAQRADRQIAAIDKVMDQSRMGRPMTTYRGARLEDLGLPATGDVVGREWTDAGYVSTSTKRDIAEHSFAGGSEGVLLTVRSPEGTPALQIDGLGETEVLLGRGQRFRVVADHGTTKSGARHLEVEVVDAPDPEQSARDRQARIDPTRQTAGALADLAQITHDQASDRALTAKIGNWEATGALSAAEASRLRALVGSSREVEVENRIRQAYRDAISSSGGRSGDRVRLTDIREALGEDFNRNEVDAALGRIARQPGAPSLQAQENQQKLTQADRDAEVHVGARKYHFLLLDDPSDRSTPSREEFSAALADIASTHGITHTSTPGDRTSFDPASMEMIGGGQGRRGAPVQVVRPGSTMPDPDGTGTVTLAKTVVMEADANPDGLDTMDDTRLRSYAAEFIDRPGTMTPDEIRRELRRQGIGSPEVEQAKRRAEADAAPELSRDPGIRSAQVRNRIIDYTKTHPGPLYMVDDIHAAMPDVSRDELRREIGRLLPHAAARETATIHTIQDGERVRIDADAPHVPVPIRDEPRAPSTPVGIPETDDPNYYPADPSERFPTPDDVIAREIENAWARIVTAHGRGAGDYAGLADIRDELGDRYPYRQVSRVLQMLNRGDALVRPENNQKALRQRDRDARVTIGNQSKHIITFDGDEGRAILARTDATRSAVDDFTTDESDGDPSIDDILAMAEDDEDVERAAGHDTTPGHDQLHHYWTVDPEGRAKWVDSPKPWTTLVAHLTRHVGLRKAKIFASRWFIEVFGYAAGSDKNRVAHGHKPRGNRVGPG